MTEEIYTSNGNVFADLGFTDADEMLAKAELVRKINLIISERELKDIEIAEILAINLSQVSDLTHGRLLNFT